ncbi:uncharacterized protein LOC134321239 [Trichomycterus rosablanca]|uniref:uncharacterized protein LOC134321239 n=1 Tax=Trichomycterus rosablanca TaxID=2290929 RepID=UPI002F35FC97
MENVQRERRAGGEPDSPQMQTRKRKRTESELRKMKEKEKHLKQELARLENKQNKDRLPEEAATRELPSAPSYDENRHDPFQMPNIQVMGPSGPDYVFRPWTMDDIRTVCEDLPPISEGGPKFVGKLRLFVEGWKPSINELARACACKLKLDWTKVQGSLPLTTDIFYDATVGGRFQTEYTNLCNRIEKGFPVRLDLTKLSQTRQMEGEQVNDFLHRLEAVHEAHCGIDKPEDYPGIVLSAWESHLKERFLSGLRIEIQKKVRDDCVEAETGRLQTILAFAVHVEKRLNEKKQRSKEDRERKEHQLQCAVLEAAKGGFGRGRGRGRGKGKQKGKGKSGPDGEKDFSKYKCYNCNQLGHIARNCPKKDNVRDEQFEEEVE